MSKIEKIILDPVKEVNRKTPEKLRVAAYCRVSTDTQDQRTSFDGQVRTYTQLIQSNPEWTLAGIYADEGITGTSADKRPEFLRMIEECEAGLIDLVITKSISRFARNTLECLTYVRKLRNMGVNIIFESNRIDTRTAFSEMLLTVLAAFAQEESRSISENTMWGIRKRFEEGVTRWCRLYGYEKNSKGEYQIVPDQAAVVQKVFWLYEHGSSIGEIRKYMEARHIKSPNGTDTWCQSAVQTMLMNERYIGDILLQKFFVEDHLTHKAIRNDHTEIPSYYIENHHTPIISRSQFERVQKIRSMRRMQHSRADEVMGACIQYPLGDKLRCPCCGSTLYQRSIPVQSVRGSGWSCERGDDACHSFIMRSNLVEQALLEAYKKLDVNKVCEKLNSPKFGAAAKKTMEIKKENPILKKVDFWWVDDLIDHIAFGAHSKTPREYQRMAALGEEATDDRTMRVYWRCGLITTVHSGVVKDRDHPAYVAECYNNYLKRQEAKKEAETA